MLHVFATLKLAQTVTLKAIKNPIFLERLSIKSSVSQNALEDVSWRLADGVLQCSFRRSIHLAASKERFNLDASYYIFLADGEAGEGKLDLCGCCCLNSSK